MYQAKVMFEAKSQDENDTFDFDAVVTYRNVASREACDFLGAHLLKSLFELPGSKVKLDVDVSAMEVKEK
jgi:hypothetical protein